MALKGFNSHVPECAAPDAGCNRDRRMVSDHELVNALNFKMQPAAIILADGR